MHVLVSRLVFSYAYVEVRLSFEICVKIHTNTLCAVHIATKICFSFAFVVCVSDLQQYFALLFLSSVLNLLVVFLPKPKDGE